MRSAEFNKFLQAAEEQVRRWINHGEDNLMSTMMIWITENYPHKSFTGWQLGKLCELVDR